MWVIESYAGWLLLKRLWRGEVPGPALAPGDRVDRRNGKAVLFGELADWRSRCNGAADAASRSRNRRAGLYFLPVRMSRVGADWAVASRRASRSRWSGVSIREDAIQVEGPVGDGCSGECRLQVAGDVRGQFRMSRWMTRGVQPNNMHFRTNPVRTQTSPTASLLLAKFATEPTNAGHLLVVGAIVP